MTQLLTQQVGNEKYYKRLKTKTRKKRKQTQIDMKGTTLLEKKKLKYKGRTIKKNDFKLKIIKKIIIISHEQVHEKENKGRARVSRLKRIFNIIFFHDQNFGFFFFKLTFPLIISSNCRNYYYFPHMWLFHLMQVPNVFMFYVSFYYVSILIYLFIL